MRAKFNKQAAALILFIIGLVCINPNLNAQDEQFKARLSVDYYNIVGVKEYLHITGKYKNDEGQYVPTHHLALNVYKEINDDSLAFVGEAHMDADGIADFPLDGFTEEMEDSVLKYTFYVKIEDNDRFKDGKDKVSFMKSIITAESIDHDSIKYVNAKLTNAIGEPMDGEDLKVQVQRLFAPIRVGDGDFETDDDGEISVEIENPLPGKDGNLTFEIIFDSRKYGIVKHIFEAPIGTPIVDNSTFDQRKMWSPPGLTPWFLLIFANLLIFGIWFVIFILLRNLFKIYKS